MLGEPVAENDDELQLPLSFDLRALQAATAALAATEEISFQNGSMLSILQLAEKRKGQ